MLTPQWQSPACGGYSRISPKLIDELAQYAVEGNLPPPDGWFEAFPPRSRTMEEWCEASGDELALGPLIFHFDDDHGDDL